MTKANQGAENVRANLGLAELQDDPVVQEGESAEQIVALEPATLPNHPLRATDVACFLPKVIG